MIATFARSRHDFHSKFQSKFKVQLQPALRFKRYSGFQLIELLAVLAITAILTVVAVPSFQNLHQRHKATATINQLLGHLQHARTHALATEQYISVCAYSGIATCGEDWSRGLYIFLDPEVNGEIEQPEQIIRQYARATDAATIAFNAALSAKYISYTPQGTSARKNSGGNIVYCSEAGETKHSKVIIFYRTGRAYLGPDKNDNGIPENGSGDDINC